MNTTEGGERPDTVINEPEVTPEKDTATEPRPMRDKLFAALANAQGAIQAAQTNKENTHFNYKYADLGACWDACRGPLADNELSVIQLPVSDNENKVAIKTVLGHSSGQYISATMSMTPEKGGPQAVGSCMQYLRRYMLCAMVGLSQQDDDANAATKDPDEYERITPEQIDQVLILADELFAENSDSVVDRMLDKLFQIHNLADLPAEHFEQALNLLKNQHKREADAAKKAAKKDD